MSNRRYRSTNASCTSSSARSSEPVVNLAIGPCTDTGRCTRRRSSPRRRPLETSQRAVRLESHRYWRPTHPSGSNEAQRTSRNAVQPRLRHSARLGGASPSQQFSCPQPITRFANTGHPPRLPALRQSAASDRHAHVRESSDTHSLPAACGRGSPHARPRRSAPPRRWANGAERAGRTTDAERSPRRVQNTRLADENSAENRRYGAIRRRGVPLRGTQVTNGGTMSQHVWIVILVAAGSRSGTWQGRSSAGLGWVAVS